MNDTLPPQVKNSIESLVKTDMGVKPAQAICNRVRTDFRGRVVLLDDVCSVVQQELRKLYPS